MCSQPYFIPEAANNFTQMCIRHYSNSAKLHWERQVQVYRIRALFTLYKYIHLQVYTYTYIVYIHLQSIHTFTSVYIHLHCILLHTSVYNIHLHFIHTLSLHTYTYILHIHLQVYTTRALFSSNNFLKTFPSGQSQHLSAHVQSCGVSSRTHQPKTFADIAATFVSSHSQSTAGLLINNIPQLLLQVQVQVRPNILLLPSQQAV